MGEQVKLGELVVALAEDEARGELVVELEVRWRRARRRGGEWAAACERKEGKGEKQGKQPRRRRKGKKRKKKRKRRKKEGKEKREREKKKKRKKKKNRSWVFFLMVFAKFFFLI